MRVLDGPLAMRQSYITARGTLLGIVFHRADFLRQTQNRCWCSSGLTAAQRRAEKLR
jgi:hypothetical protein